jgi:hypothetical protein
MADAGMDDGNSPFTSVKDALKDSKRIKNQNDYLTNSPLHQVLEFLACSRTTFP